LKEEIINIFSISEGVGTFLQGKKNRKKTVKCKKTFKKPIYGLK